MTKPKASPATVETGGDDLSHIYCCDPDTALCGTDISGTDDAEFDEADCVVCADLESVGALCALCMGGGA